MSSPASVRSAMVSASSVSHSACRRRTSSAPASSSRSAAKWRTVSSIMKRPSRRRSRLLSTSAAEALERHVAYALGGFQRAAADEDAEACKRLALVRPQQVVAPVDRGGERLLACRRVARAGRQQVRLAFEPLENLSRREQLRSRRGELDRERQPVEPPADAGDLRGAGRVELEARIDRLRPHREEPHRVGLDERLERKVGVGSVERRHRVLALGCQPQRGAARGEDPEARGRGEEVADEGRGGEDLLEVVEHEQHPPLAQVLDHTVGRAFRSPSRTSSDSAIVATRSSGSETGARPTNSAPSRSSGSSSCATASPILVLPVPPGPVRVTSRAPSSRNSALTAASSSRRPTSGVGGTGQRPRRAGWRFRSGEARVLPEDRPLQLLQGWARVEAEILREGFAGFAIDLERIRLAAAAVEREHPLLEEPLAIRLVGRERLELGDDSVVAAARELRVEAKLERAEPQLLEPLGLGGSASLVRQIGESRASPDRERLPEVVGRVFRAAGLESRPAALERALEAVEVELVLLDDDAVAAAGGLDAARRRARGAGRARRPATTGRPTRAVPRPRARRSAARLS